MQQEKILVGVSWQQKESAYYIVGAIAEAFDDEQMAKFNIQASVVIFSKVGLYKVLKWPISDHFLFVRF